MKKRLLSVLGCLSLMVLVDSEVSAQVTLSKDYQNKYSAAIGTFKGVNFREGGFSALFAIPGTGGKEFWTCSDRGVNIDAANANPSGCHPTYDKMYAFPTYAPKIHRIRINGDSVQILRTITVKRPSGSGATGLINPTGLGSTSAEVPSTDTVLNCANFNAKTVAKDTFGIDPEGIVVDKNGYFWLCEEGGPSVWKLDQNGKLIKRYTPYANLGGAQAVDVAMDTVFKYRKNNRGFEGIAITPNGKIYAMIQSPLLYPSKTVGENTRVHRLLEIDPTNNSYRMFAYLNDGIIGTGSDQIRLRDWKLGELEAINDSMFLVVEAAARGITDIKRVYTININGATVVNSGLYGGSTLEALVDSIGLAGQNIKAVKKTLFVDLLANGWPAALDKCEGIAIINDSTVAFCNDNDYGQASLAEDGLPIANNNNCHVIVYSLSGSSKFSNYRTLGNTLSQGITGPSTGTSPYLVPTVPDVNFTSIATATEVYGAYKMVGLPDGLGAFDNNDGTFTVLMNHELGKTAGIARAHGSIGAFVSRWVINKSDFKVVNVADQMKKIFLWNPLTSAYTAYNSSSPSSIGAFDRFCSADLPAPTAFYNPATGMGTMERIFMDGEESGTEGRAMGHIVTGPNNGNSYELPRLGKISWENALANPATGDKTVVAGMDDATPGQVYFYVGTKTNSGNEIEKAGLTNGKLYGPVVSGLLIETSASVPAVNTPFTMADLGNVENMTGATIQTNSTTAGVTQFLRPEDGAWDPSNPSDYYFVTTNAFNSPSRLWKFHFSDINNIPAGGTLSNILNGTEGQQMFDNMTIDNYGHILMVEDVGNNAHLGKVWQYTIDTKDLKQIAAPDSTRFLNGSSNFLTQDEEASGIVDAQEILGPGMFLTVLQDHHAISGEVVEGGQLLTFFNPDSYNSNPEIDITGNNISIINGDMTPTSADNTDFGKANKSVAISKDFVINNAGPGKLTVSGISISGTNTADFNVKSAPAFPFSVAPGAKQIITVEFKTTTIGNRTAMLNIASNDFDERMYAIAIQAAGVEPKIAVKGNNILIIDGDATAGSANNTYFGDVKLGLSSTKNFDIQNTGTGTLTVSSVNLSGTNSNEFTVTSPATFPVTVAAGSSAPVTVKFTPTAIGIRNATLNIVNDDASTATYDFSVEGNGLDSATSIGAAAAFISSITLYPNPTGNEATISVTVKKDGCFVVNVVDIQGKLVIPSFEQNLKAGKEQIKLNTSSLNSGIYFVQLSSGDATAKIKMVVAH